MSLASTSVKNHVFAYMFAFVIVLFGVVSFFRISIDRLPKIDIPSISIVTIQNGTTAEIVDKNITSVIERNVNGISGIDTIYSTSRPSRSVVTINFDLEKNIDVAFAEVQAKVGEVVYDLPEDADPPIIIKRDVSSSPIIWLSLSGDRTLLQLSLYADNIIKKKLENINGVSEVSLVGMRDRIIKIEIKMDKMIERGIGTNDVISAIQKQHLQLPGGYLVNDSRELIVKLDLELHSIKDLENIIVKSDKKSYVRLKDVANIVDDLDDFRSYSSYNGKPAIAIGVSKMTDVSAFDVEKEVYKRVNEEIIPSLEPGTTLQIVYNDVDYIKALVGALKEHLYLGTLLTAIIVFIFLGSFVSTIIISIAIPVSLLAAVFFMYVMGYTFNSITMLALLLLIGVVVDDAIVVLENIYRNMENGKNRIKAAIEGTEEVIFPVLAATLSLVCIFGPVIFMEGMVGRFFRSFAVVITFGVIASYFVSVIVTPMLCSRFMTISHNKKNFFSIFEIILKKIEKYYVYILQFCLRSRITVMILVVGLFLTSFLFMSKVGKDFIPEGDESNFSILVITPLGTSIHANINKAKEIENLISKNKEITGVQINIGRNAQAVNRMDIDVYLIPVEKRKVSYKEVMKKVREQLATVVGIEYSIFVKSGASGGEKLQFYLKSTNFKELLDAVFVFDKNLKQNDMFKNVILKLRVDYPQVIFDLDREKMSLIGVSALDVGNAISATTGGLTVGKFNFNDSVYDDRYDIKVRANDSEILSEDDFKKIYITTKNGGMVRLDNVVSFVQELTVLSITRTSLQYGAEFGGNTEMDLGTVSDILQQEVKKLTGNFSIEFRGEVKELKKTIASVTLVFFLSILLLYMVLASQFNSFVQPIYIMISEPFAIYGGLLFLFLFDKTLNMFSMISFVLLIGLVAKNAILLIDLTNKNREQGMSIERALIQACPVRLRPILMTSLTVIITMIPTAFSTGSGSNMNAPLAVGIVGGMISSTVLTLFIIPVVYSLIENLISKKGRVKNEF